MKKSCFHIFYLPTLFAVIALISLLSGCSNSDEPSTSSNQQKEVPGEEVLEASSPLLRLLDADQTGIDFKNHLEETQELNITTHINTSNGGGVAIFDANNDGLQDIYFVSTSGENKFYVNKGGLSFTDATATSGLGSSGGFEIAVTAVDINTDGFLDLYVCRGGPTANEERRNKLFINNQDLTFTDKAAEYGLNDKSASIGANFFDYDLDGDLDLYLVNYPVDFSYSNRINVRPTKDGSTVEPILDPISEFDSDRFYRNDGPPTPDKKGVFKDVSRQAGIWNFAYGMTATVEDFNNDGWPDVYVANDFIQPDLLYINNRNGTFTNRIGDYFKHTSQHTMGVDLADFDNDGLFDLFGVDMLSHTNYRRKTVVSTNTQNKYTSLVTHNYFQPVVRNVLQRNNGNNTFSDIACMAEVYQTDWSWSGLMADLDNDGWKDLLVTNGYQRELTDMDFINFTMADIKSKGTIAEQFPNIHDFLAIIPQYKVRDFVFKNNGDLTFENKNGEWLTAPATWSNGAATGDLDNDGDIDYVVNNLFDEALVYENLAKGATQNNFIQFTCHGPVKNPNGVGTRITIFQKDSKQYQILNPSRGIFSSVEHLFHFGLGSNSKIDSVHIVWADGKFQKLVDLNGNQRVTLNYAEANSPRSKISKAANSLFREITNTNAFKFRHQENDYIDFEFHFLLPWTLSDLGPLMATADVNKDGLTDVYIGNSFGKTRGIYIQGSTGKFDILHKAEWDMDTIYEDHGAIFFDADMDADMDLFVVSGGYEAVAPQAWQGRLYINDNGTFRHARGAIPLLEGTGLRAASFDYDSDGDQDIIIGGRVTPGKYPQTPKSYVLRNDRNKFVDVTLEVAPELSNIGMVTDLHFANVDQDKMPELILCGEWMPITIFKIESGKFKKLDSSQTGMEYSNGFWNRLIPIDIDKDGDLDLITGNIGLNTSYKPTNDHPIQCYFADYDLNGSIDPLITFYEEESIYPIIQKDVLIKQIPSLKKKFIYYKDYAKATIEDVLTEKQLKESKVLKSYIVKSGWWENTNGNFSFHDFKNPAQASPVYGIIADDLDGDGNIDVLLAGNKYGMEVETGRLDAGVGVFLKGDGQGGFTWVKNTDSGFWAQKDVRDIALLIGPGNKKRIVVANNNDDLQIFEENRK